MSLRQSMKVTPLFAAVLGFLLVLPGCGPGTVTKENFGKLKPGMSEQEVSDILGAPTGTQATAMPNVPGMPAGGAMPKNIKQLVWQAGDKAIIVQFIDGKAVGIHSTNL